LEYIRATIEILMKMKVEEFKETNLNKGYQRIQLLGRKDELTVRSEASSLMSPGS
jgi:hypothetical protein